MTADTVLTKKQSEKGTAVACLLALGYGCLLSVLAVLRHAAVNTHAFDLGLFHQVVWNTHVGEWFRFTYWVGFKPDPLNYLGDHVSITLLPISWLSWIHDGPETLLVLQAFFLASGILPLYFLGRHWGLRQTPALVLAGVYGIHPMHRHTVVCR